MPRKPKECQQHAENCRQLAAESRTVWGRHTLLCIADRWEQLAAELESAQPLIKATSAVVLPLSGTLRKQMTPREGIRSLTLMSVKHIEPPRPVHFLNCKTRRGSYGSLDSAEGWSPQHH
jgi:hypothetical protein